MWRGGFTHVFVSLPCVVLNYSAVRVGGWELLGGQSFTLSAHSSPNTYRNSSETLTRAGLDVTCIWSSNIFQQAGFPGVKDCAFKRWAWVSVNTERWSEIVSSSIELQTLTSQQTETHRISEVLGWYKHWFLTSLLQTFTHFSTVTLH